MENMSRSELHNKLDSCKQKIAILVDALQQYAISDNWGETSSFKTKIQNRFLVKTYGGKIAVDALAEVDVHIFQSKSDADKHIEEQVDASINEYIEIHQSEGYKPGWVMHQLENDGLIPKLNLEQWKYLAAQLEYTQGWALYRFKENAEVQ